MRILKFGGTSVGNADRIRGVFEIVKPLAQSKAKPWVVVSAMQGITNLLIDAGKIAARGEEKHCELFEKIATTHHDCLNNLFSGADAAERTISALLDELQAVLRGVSLVRELSARTLAYISSFGERLSAHLVAAYFCRQGIPAEYIDARTLIKTNDDFNKARVDFEQTNMLIQSFAHHRDALPIITGFIGATLTGDTTTLGRGGSDYTASIIGAAIKAEEIEIWTDVDGVLTADPRKVKKAFPIPHMTFEEAMELSHFGAKVIYPPTMQPALDANIPLRIKNTLNPSAEGTMISSSATENTFPITGISSIDNIALLRISGSGMIGVAGISMRLFGALARHHISVIFITQASSEHTICFAVDPNRAREAKRVLDAEFALEIEANLIGETLIEEGLSILSVVGENMRNTSGVSGKIFQAVGKNGINIVAIAQGSSELNISFVVSQNDETKALNAIHDEFFLSDRKALHVFLAGVGLIGGTLLRQIRDHAPRLARENHLEIKLCGVTNSSKSAFNSDGCPFEEAQKLIAASEDAADPAHFVRRMKALNLPNSIFIDCTASTQFIEFYPEMLRCGISIVTPNKKSLSSDQALYNEIKAAGRTRSNRMLYETCVGAGLPVISTLSDLIKSGDQVQSIQAVLSGTLSFLFNSYDGSMPFSEIVRLAKEKGFTEPDPRDDLSGLDVARKLLILARETGVSLELRDIEVENLVPEACRTAPSVEEFLNSLATQNEEFAARLHDAKRRAGKLCYIASLRDGKAKVALEVVDATHPFASLSGSDNIISFTTERYAERPLVVKGPGAGAEVTAAGVFADLIRIG